MMVLTQFIYSALGSQGVTSSQALADPFNRVHHAGPRLRGHQRTWQNAIGDSHFVTRDRMGRTLAFMCRIAGVRLVSHQPRAIAVDEETALLIDGSGRRASSAQGRRISSSRPVQPKSVS